MLIGMINLNANHPRTVILLVPPWTTEKAGSYAAEEGEVMVFKEGKVGLWDGAPMASDLVMVNSGLMMVDIGLWRLTLGP